MTDLTNAAWRKAIRSNLNNNYRRFRLDRQADVSSVSCTGALAEGIQLSGREPAGSGVTVDHTSDGPSPETMEVR
jgi:hypothetical protein